jgi:hypothetical protein
VPLDRLARPLGAHAPFAATLAASAALGWVATRGILERAGGPALPLDDAFIHLRYAQRLAEGHFFSYVPGEGYTTGATSPLWPVLLAPFFALGARGLAMVHVVWALGTLAHAGLALETGRLARALAGRAAGVGAAAMCLVFGAFAWFAWSGMETVLLAWLLMRSARVASTWCDDDTIPSPRAAAELVLLGLITPLVRPEGALASLIAAAALAYRPSRPGLRARLVALGPLAGPLLVPFTNLALAGHAASSTTSVKWMVGNPYYPGTILATVTLANARLLVEDLLNGGPWTALFLPEGASAPILLGLVALFVVAARERASHRAVFVAIVALGALIPCTYVSFLWNRVRYIWPFAGAWIVGVACLARLAGDLAARAHRHLAALGPLALGLAAGALATKLPWTLSDLAQSARAIDRQQVTLGRWAASELPEDARIGVNDTGAIAYMSGRPTFDVVGLTTEGEARYWVAGAGSRLEHYERTPRERLPTHFIVYPQWMACPAVLGAPLVEATVLDQSILGGVTMVAYEADYAALGSGALPASITPEGRLVDEVDVSDLESEAEHGYLIEPGAWDADNLAGFAPRPGAPEDEPVGRWIADGGRVARARDRFLVELSGGRASLVARLSAEQPVTLDVRVGGRGAGTIEVPAGFWVERAVSLPATVGRGRVEVTIEARGGARFAAYHYWSYGG